MFRRTNEFLLLQMSQDHTPAVRLGGLMNFYCCRSFPLLVHDRRLGGLMNFYCCRSSGAGGAIRFRRTNEFLLLQIAASVQMPEMFRRTNEFLLLQIRMRLIMFAPFRRTNKFLLLQIVFREYLQLRLGGLMNFYCCRSRAASYGSVQFRRTNEFLLLQMIQ